MVREAVFHHVHPAYGMLAELLGPLPVRVQLQALSADDLALVLSEPADSLVREYTELLALDGVKLHFEKTALRAIPEAAIAERCGARRSAARLC